MCAVAWRARKVRWGLARNNIYFHIIFTQAPYWFANRWLSPPKPTWRRWCLKVLWNGNLKQLSMAFWSFENQRLKPRGNRSKYYCHSILPFLGLGEISVNTWMWVIKNFQRNVKLIEVSLLLQSQLVRVELCFYQRVPDLNVNMCAA